MEKYKIIDKRPEASHDMIEDTMDFEGLLTKHGASTGGSSFKLIKSLAITGILMLLGYLSVVYFFISDDQNHNQSEGYVATEEVEQPELFEQKKTLDSAESISVEPAHDVVEKIEHSNEKTPETPIEVDNKSDEEQSQGIDKAPSVTVEKETAEYEYVDAIPVDGIAALYDYFDSTLKYPEEALPDSIQGVTLVTFTINVQGKAEKVVIEKSLGEMFDQEALRVINGMPIWHPASINGQDIKSKVSIPLTFRIEK